MVHIESIENALSVGDFVVVLCDAIACSTPSSEGTPKKHKIGRIIDINDSGEKCHLNWWIRPSEEPILSPYSLAYRRSQGGFRLFSTVSVSNSTPFSTWLCT